MKKKLLLFGIVLMVFHTYIDRYIFKIKNTYYATNRQGKNEIYQEFKNKIRAEVLENRYHTLIINKGYIQGVKLHQIVVGINGFIGTITKVESNVAEVRTFWHRNNNYILVNGSNAYGYLKSNGYYLTVKNYHGSNPFQNEDKVYLYFNEGVILFGIFLVKRITKQIMPVENITELKQVYISKSE